MIYSLVYSCFFKSVKKNLISKEYTVNFVVYIHKKVVVHDLRYYDNDYINK
jgi:hypothetical protein